MPGAPFNEFVNYTAAQRKPMLVAFGLFNNSDSLAFIYSVATGTSGYPVPMIGTIDGVNAVFTLPAAPVNGAMVIRNGLVLDPTTSYVLIGSTVTFNAANIPQVGDLLDAIVS